MPNYITWLGHSTFKIETGEGRILLIDPWLQGNPACPDAAKHLSRVDVILCTHGHPDHIGDAVAISRQFQPTVIAIYELAAWLGSKGAKHVSPMNKGGSQEAAGVKITMVHAQHSSGIQLEDGSILYGGEACGYVLELPGGLRIYHAGDTDVFGDMQLIHQLYQPEICLLPIGDHFTMGPREAELACSLLKPRIVIPMHYGTFPILKGGPADLADAAQRMNFEIWQLEPGKRDELVLPRQLTHA